MVRFLVASRKRSLSLQIWLYTLFCVVLSVGLFVLVAVWLLPSRPSPGSHHPPNHAVQVDSSEQMRSQYLIPLDGPPPKQEPGIPTQLFLITGGALLVVVLLTSILFARRLIRPLSQLQTAAMAFGAGTTSARAHVQRNDEIGAVGEAFDTMADQTMRLIQSQRELLANVSHELRTPMARIRVALDLAAEGDSQTARSVLGEIEIDLCELETLVSDVLMSAQLDASLILAKDELFDSVSVVRAAHGRFMSISEEHHVDLNVQVCPTKLRGDSNLLRRSLDNLLSNARKYSEPSSPLKLRIFETSETTIIEIRDCGIGISEEDLANVFTPFFRADRSRTRTTGGVGLGLSLTRKIVAAHGGTVSLASTLGVGTTATIEIPHPAA